MDQVARRAFASLALGAGLLVPPPDARAQNVASLSGRVVHSASKAGIPSAEVRLSPYNRLVATDSAGYFAFERVPPGSVSVLVRRLGFAPESTSFTVRTADDLEILIELEQSAQPLDTVTVAGRENTLRRGKLAGFYERKRSGFGHFFDSDILERQQDRRLGELITASTPGSRLVRSLTGSMAWIATTRRTGIIFGGSAVDEYDRNRGADPRACYPDVYLDGIVVYSFGSGMSLFDINSIATAHLSAVEFYVGPSQTPLLYNKTSAVCGVLLIWTK